MIEKNEIKTKQHENLIDETKLQDELIILKAKEMEPVTKIESVSFISDETPAEVQAPIEAIAESELLPTLTKEETSIGMEPPTAVSMEDSFQPPTIHDKEDLKDDTIPLVSEPYKPDIEKIRIEEIQITDVAQDIKEIEISKYAERDATVEDLIDDKLSIHLVTSDKTVISIDEEETLVVPKIEREEVITEIEKISEMLPIIKVEEVKFVEKEIPQLDETTDIKEMVPHMEIISMDEIVEVPPVPEIEEMEQKETIPAMDVIEVKEIIPEVISPTVDITEVEKFEPDKFPIVDVEKVSIEEEIEIEKPTPILDVKEEPLFLDMEEKIEEPVLIKEEIKAAELPPITDVTEKEQIEVTELLPIEDIEQKEDIEVVTLPPILDVAKEEKIEAEELLALADVVTEEKVEIIQPIQPTLPTIKKEIEEEIEGEEPVLEVKIKEEKDEEITLPEKVTYIELPEKKKEEEMPPVEEKKIPTEIPPSKEPTLKDEKEVPVEKIKPEIHIELKIPIAEIKSTEMEMPAIPQLVAQPYLIIAKIKEKEVLQIIPAKQPCAECCLVSKCYSL